MDKYTAGLRETAFEYGIKRLAHDLDMSEGRLYKKLDPDGPVSLTLADFFRINRILNDVRCLDRALEDLGMVATPVAESTDDIEGEIRELLLDSHDMAASFTRVIRAAKADGEICDDDLAEIKALRRELAVMGNTVMSRIEAMHANGKAALKAVK
ncbi:MULTISPECIES: phage regulatory CII family protein [unclassified Halomonas]|uniref:phage regulatory CII family protein n=1 Tax=unclassified Halomonas TaxID=2609666 RepID=UPI002076BD75|nr:MULTISPECIES: phage regulatory CII family protein [unclassified Halomonas]